MPTPSEIDVADPELDSLMAELEAEAAKAGTAPAAPETEPVIEADAAEAASAIAELEQALDGEPVKLTQEQIDALLPPEAKVPQKVTVDDKVNAIIAEGATKKPEGNFVVPTKVEAVTDPLPWEDNPETGADTTAASAPVTPQPAAAPVSSGVDMNTLTVPQIKAHLVSLAKQHGSNSPEFLAAKQLAQEIVADRKAAEAAVDALTPVVEAAKPAPDAAGVVNGPRMFGSKLEELEARQPGITEAIKAVAAKGASVDERNQQEIERHETMKPTSPELKKALKDLDALPEPDKHNPKLDPDKSPLKFSIDPDEFQKEVALSETLLDDAQIKQASLRARYGAVSRNAEAQAARVKVRVQVMEAALYEEHRKLMAKAGEKVTEKAVENAVKTDPRWEQLQNKLIEANLIADVNRELVESLKDKRDMIVQMGADRREEGKGAVRTLMHEELKDRAAQAAKR